jgi:hypothetical protein
LPQVVEYLMQQSLVPLHFDFITNLHETTLSDGHQRHSLGFYR